VSDNIDEYERKRIDYLIHRLRSYGEGIEYFLREGEIHSGDNTIDVPKNFLKNPCLIIIDKDIKHSIPLVRAVTISLSEKGIGRPEVFYRKSFEKFGVCPFPDKNYKFALEYQGLSDELMLVFKGQCSCKE
jgi:hypothetical protein